MNGQGSPEKPTTPEAIARALAEYFEPDEVKYKPAVVSGNRALALWYVDARVIEDRLDDVMGVTGWQDEYQIEPDGSVVCRLRLKIAGEWLTKVDVGSPSEQPDGGDRLKAAFSDSLKRAAVKWGVGRYLYRMPSQWCDYDAHKKQFLRPPQIPAAFLPRKAGAPATKQPAPQTSSAGKQAAPEKKIDAETLALLRAAMAENGVPEQALLDNYQIKALADLPDCHVQNALSRCLASGKAKKAPKKEAAPAA